MRVPCRTALFAALALASVAWADTPDTRPLRAIVGGTLIDGTGGPPRTNVGILLEGDRIAWVGPAAELKVGAGERVLRADGKFILPGFMDAHVHYRDHFPELLITHGVTSVAEWGNSPVPWLLAQRDGIKAGKIFGPRIFTSGDSYSEEPEEQTAEKAARWLEKMIALKVDKIDIGFASPPEVLKVLIDGGHRAGLSVSTYSAYSSDAIDLGIDAIKHTYSVGIASQTDPALVAAFHEQAALAYHKRDIEMPLITQDPTALARRLASHKVNWVPTLVKDFKVVTDRREQFEAEAVQLLLDPNLDYLPRADMFAMVTSRFGLGLPTPAGMRFTLVKSAFDPIDFRSAAFERYHAAYGNLQKLIRQTVAFGGHVLAGTAPHSYVLPGLALHQEMQLFVDAGLTPMQTLQSATLWVAQYLRQDKDLGSVEAGKLADITVLDRNPLVDIRNTRSVSVVLQGGREQTLGYHFSYRNPIPRSTRRNSPGGTSPTPTVASFKPQSVPRGGGAVEITLVGELFEEGARVYAGDIPLETRFVSGRELRATLPASLIADVGTQWISAVNPPPGRPQSTPLPLIVRY